MELTRTTLSCLTLLSFPVVTSRCLAAVTSCRADLSSDAFRTASSSSSTTMPSRLKLCVTFSVIVASERTFLHANGICESMTSLPPYLYVAYECRVHDVTTAAAMAASNDNHDL